MLPWGGSYNEKQFFHCYRDWASHRIVARVQYMLRQYSQYMMLWESKMKWKSSYHISFLCTLCTLYIVECSMACGPLWKLYKPKIEYSRAPQAKRTKKGHKKQLQKKRSNSPFTKFASNAFLFLKRDFFLSVFHSFQVWRSKKIAILAFGTLECMMWGL